MRAYWFMIAYYGASAVYQGYMSLFYGKIGLNRAQIGMVNAAAAVSALAAQPLWGAAGDRVSKRRGLLCALCAASALIFPTALLGGGLYLQILSAAAFYAFYSALLPLGDAAVLASDAAGKYGKIRMWGGLSYAVFSLLGGWLIGKARVEYALWAVVLLLGAAAVCALLLPDQQKARRRGKLFSALRDPELRGMLLFMLPSQIGMGFFYSFFALHFMRMKGASGALLGAANLLAALSEIPYLMLSDRLYRRVGAEKSMLLATAALALRFCVLGAAKSAWVALLSQVLNGFGYIAVGVSMAKYVADRLPQNAVGGQTLISLSFYGASRLIGSLLGGFAAQKVGVARAFWLMALLCALGDLLFWVRLHRRRACR